MIIDILAIIVIIAGMVFFYGMYKVITSFLKIHTDFYFSMFGIKRKKK